MTTTTPHRIALLLLMAMAATSAACIYDGLVVEDGTGFSRGPSRLGILYEGTKLPARGQGYWIPPTWSKRGLNYGIDELVSTIVYSGRVLHSQDARLRIGVADMSREHGGRSPWHRSHQTGRDVDFLLFTRDKRGRPLRSSRMRKFAPTGVLREDTGSDSEVFFDVRANWLLVAALLDNPDTEVQYIFIQDDLRELLLSYAAEQGVSAALLRRASETLLQPSDSAPHDDHMHVRVYCPLQDIPAGCIDFGQMRWHKRNIKYPGRLQRLRRYNEVTANVALGNFAWFIR